MSLPLHHITSMNAAMNRLTMPALRLLPVALLMHLAVFAAGTGLATAAETRAPCVFCEIAAGTRDATRVVYRDDTVVAFLDRAPRNAGHVLVVPRRHADNILDVSPATLARVAEVAQSIAQAIKRTDLRAEGYTVQSNTGAAAGQTVFHLHFHVIPRFRGEPPAGGEKAIAPEPELAVAAAKIRAALAAKRDPEAFRH